MLILSDADGFGIDLDKLCKWVLDSACDGNSTALCYVKIGEFLCAELGSGVNRCTGFACDDIFCADADLLERFRNKDFAFFRCRTVTDRNDIDIIFCYKIFDDLL